MNGIKTFFGIVLGIAIALVGVGVAALALRGRSAPPAIAPEPTQVGSVAPPQPAPPPPRAPTVGELIDAEAQRLSTLSGVPLAAALEDFAATSSGATYPQLERNAEAWAGDPVMFTGTIAEIQDEPGVTIIRLATASYGRNILWIETSPSCVPDRTIVANDRVRVYGYLAGDHTYESQAHYNITLPALLAIAVVPSRVPAHVSASDRTRFGLAQAAASTTTR